MKWDHLSATGITIDSGMAGFIMRLTCVLPDSIPEVWVSLDWVQPHPDRDIQKGLIENPNKRECCYRINFLAVVGNCARRGNHPLRWHVGNCPDAEDPRPSRIDS